MTSWGLFLLSLGGLLLMQTSLNEQFVLYHYFTPVLMMIIGLIIIFKRKGGKENESDS